jgi:hypothetical protein
LIRDCKKAYFIGLIEESKDQKDLYKQTKKLLHKSKPTVLPSHAAPAELANKFAGFFSEKISKIRANIEAKQTDLPPCPQYLLPSLSHLTSLPLASEEEVKKLIMKSPSKSCALDPIPTWLLKSHMDAITLAITTIIRKSITSATVPDCLKEALVTLLLKKASLNKELFKNYRPVSNLSFVSKLLEKHVDKHLSDCVETNNLTETFQSALLHDSSMRPIKYAGNHQSTSCSCDARIGGCPLIKDIFSPQSIQLGYQSS